MDTGSKKILLIAGDGTCFNALNEFALSFEEGLKSRGYSPEIMYLNKLDQKALNDLVNCDCTAVVGFQTNLFTLEISEGIYVGNLLQVPKYNFILDPPTTKRQYFSARVNNLTYFYHDTGYIGYLGKYFPWNRVMFLPPAGGVTGLNEDGIFTKERKYGLTFVGTYTDYRHILDSVTERLPDWAELIMAFFEYLIQDPGIGVVRGIETFIGDNSLDISQDGIPALLEILYPAENAARSYYREEIIKTLLENGRQVDVFSGSWNASPYAGHKKLKVHLDISYRDSMEVFADSRLSLNVFSWHKDSMTERIANIMLGGAVCLSDHSGKLGELFNEDKELVMYDLKKLEELPDKVSYILDNDDIRMSIARAGYDNAYRNHRWINRVDEFVSILQDRED